MTQPQANKTGKVNSMILLNIAYYTKSLLSGTFTVEYAIKNTIKLNL